MNREIEYKCLECGCLTQKDDNFCYSCGSLTARGYKYINNIESGIVSKKIIS